MDERRGSNRIPKYVALRIDAGERANRTGVSLNWSETGMLFHSLSRFSIGDRLDVTLVDDQRRLTAVVVRTEHDGRPGILFRWRTAVRFES